MRAGKIASLCLILVLAMLATLATTVRRLWFPPLTQWIEARPPIGQILIVFAILCAAFALVIVPLGFAFDRSFARLRDSLASSTGAGKSGGVVCYGPRWLAPVTRAITGAIDRSIEREQALQSQLRDLEIRHRVSEAERRQISSVLNSLRDGVLVTDVFNEILMANAAAAQVLGFDLQAAHHHPIEAVLKDEALCRLIRGARETANRADRRHVEHEIDGRDGEGPSARRVFDVTLSCVENHRHEVSGVVTILHDLTSEREISQMKSDFVSKASHELRTPLSSIRAYLEMLIDGEATDDESRMEFYRVMQSETQRLGRLIDNMLNISRIEAGIVQIERDEVDIRSLIERAIETIGPQAREKNMSLHTRLSALDLTVEGDADMLYQVVLNLLSNSVKYTPEGGRVTIGSDSDNLTRSVVVSVADTGLGIPPDALPRLFDKFFRVENYKRMANGTGLGLNLCKHIVETVHHGQIGVESKLGMGSRFWFSVPMRYAGSKAAA